MHFKFSLTFVLQPVSSWLSEFPEETAVFSFLDKRYTTPIDSILSYQLYTSTHSSCKYQCMINEIPFIDANSAASFTSSDWLFADRVHLTNLGNLRLAQFLASHYL